MIDIALYDHLQASKELASYLTTYAGRPAIFSQEAPSDQDPKWAPAAQYGRIVFTIDFQGDPARAMGANLSVDIYCDKHQHLPEEIEPIARQLIDGYFFSAGLYTMAAQWLNSNYFTTPNDDVIGVTISYVLLAFPMLTTSNPDVIARINEWTADIDGLHVINFDKLPCPAWKPKGTESAVYWRLMQDTPAGWIPDTFQTIWRTAILKCHVFSADIATATNVTDHLAVRLHAAKRLLKAGEAPIMVNRKNTADYTADALRTGQLTVEATYGVIVHIEPDTTLANIEFNEKKGDS